MDAHSPSGKSVESKICGVCGDKALGYNFNAITCESCKAFFRRNALKKKDFKCPFNDNCKVDVVTRRFCQKCRLKKCFDIGMKKEWIMTEEEKKIKKQKIEENRQKRQMEVQTHKQMSPASIESMEDSPKPPSVPIFSGHSNSDYGKPQARVTAMPHQPHSPLENSNSEESESKFAPSTDDNSDLQSPQTNVKASEYDSMQSPNSVISVDVQSPCSATSSLEPFSPQSSIISQSSPSVICNSLSPPAMLMSTSNECRPSSSSSSGSDSKPGGGCNHYSSHYNSSHESVNNVLNVVIKSEFNSMSGMSQLTSSSRELTDGERSKLSELIIANKAMKSPVQNDPRVTGVSDPSLLNVINMTDIAIRRLIKMSKKINGFKNLCQEDQIALLKGGCTELMILRSVMTYDPEKDCWQGPKQTLCIKLEVLREARGNIYEEHKRFIHSFHPGWRSDENIMLILSAITLFNPNRTNIIHKDVIKLEQDSYYFLLRRYLESLYSGCEARSTYLKLLQKMEELHILNENHVRVFLDVNPKDVEPLLIEIFDLKNH